MSGPESCALLEGPRELEEAIRSRDRLFVLFYAEWCGFSQAFLPEYLDYAERGEPCYARIVCDDGDPFVEKYRIDVYPTVLYFEKGKVVRRLDGLHFRGLSRKSLEKFVAACAVGT